MKKTRIPEQNRESAKKGYNEKNPGEPEGAFPPASGTQPVNKKNGGKSNAADKKAKEDQR